MTTRGSSGALTVLKPGMLTTVQDLGRRGHQSVGVPVSGPMDFYSHRLANDLLGNDPHAAALEITLIGPELMAEGNLACAVTGADFDLFVDTMRVPLNRVFEVASGARIRFGERRRGARAALAVRGGFDLPPTLGSCATHLASHMGPFGGRAVRAGDVLPAGRLVRRAPGVAAPVPLPLPEGGGIVRVVPAVHRERFTEAAWTVLTGSRFVVTPQSNRMGYRLEGPPLQHAGAADILSEGMPPGVIQVPSSGQAILLMAERATTGGYATIANVISADLPIAGQLAPGDWIRFQPCTHDDALAALRMREAALSATDAGSH